MLSAAPDTVVELARYPFDADPDVARQTHRCKTSDLGKESEVAGSFKARAFKSQNVIIHNLSMIDSRASGVALLDSLNLSPIARKQLARPTHDQEQSRRTSPLHELTTHKQSPASPPPHQQLRQRCSKGLCHAESTERGVPVENAWQIRLDQDHDPVKASRLGAGTGPERFATMIKSATESVHSGRATGSPA